MITINRQNDYIRVSEAKMNIDSHKSELRIFLRNENSIASKNVFIS